MYAIRSYYEVNFEQEIYTHVNYFLQTRQQIEMAHKTDQIAEKRYEVAKKRYMIGKITITDINIAVITSYSIHYTKLYDYSKKQYRTQYISIG